MGGRDREYQLASWLAEGGGLWTGEAGAGPNLSKILWRSWLLVFAWFMTSLHFCLKVEE